MMRRAACILLGWVLAAACAAHPLGNLSVNRQAAIVVDARQIDIRYTLDLAEIPSLTAAEEADADLDGQTTSAEWRGYARRWAANTLAQLDLKLDGQALTLVADNPRWTLKPGAAGLQLLRLEAHYRAMLPRDIVRATLDYRDHAAIPQLVWSEVFLIAAADVKRLGADVPAHDRSRGLSVFPSEPDVVFPNESQAHAELVWPPFAATKTATALLAPAQAKAVAMAAPRSRVEQTAASVSPSRHLRPFFLLGVHHIATGWDHLAFVAGLLLLRLPWRKLIKVITAFTVAHSLTLALAALGWVAPPGALVEPAIALSVAYVGLAVVLRRGERGSLLLAFAFGLIHGFGFAGALAESMAGEQADSAGWLVALASFNLGIEAFQLALVAAVAPVLIGLRRYRWEHRLRRIGGALVMSAGLCWFFARALV